jgi:SAM-dependent methyltransferase
VRTESVSYDRIAARYEQARGGLGRARQLAEAITPWIAQADVVCDVGAGTGVVSGLLAEAGSRVFGFDLAPKMLSQARARLPGRVAVADAAALPVAGGTVDALVYVWVLHHVGDLAAAMREARRVLRPGGRAVCVSGLALPRPDDDIDLILRGLDHVLRRTSQDHIPALASAAAAAGLEAVAEAEAAVTVESSPNEVADAVEQRLFAYLWDLDETTWAEVVQPRVDALRRLPGPDRPRHRQARHPVRVLKAPAAGGQPARPRRLDGAHPDPGGNQSRDTRPDGP